MDHFMCPRVEVRMECPECKYPYSEARCPLDKKLPHLQTQCEDLIMEVIHEWEENK